MAIVVAPATSHNPGTPTTENVYGDSTGTITGTALAQSFTCELLLGSLYGDAEQISGTGRGGDDRFQATSVNTVSTLFVWGDAPNFTDAAQGGNDWITTVNSVNDILVYADAYLMFGESRGGNDRIDGDAKTAIYGDALVLNDLAADGDDVL